MCAPFHGEAVVGGMRVAHAARGSPRGLPAPGRRPAYERNDIAVFATTRVSVMTTEVQERGARRIVAETLRIRLLRGHSTAKNFHRTDLMRGRLEAHHRARLFTERSTRNAEALWAERDRGGHATLVERHAHF